MKNSLADLNNHLFAQMERLSDESLKGEQLQEEINRAKAVTGISTQIISNARLVLDAEEYRRGLKPEDTPEVLRVGKSNGA
ncbi:hypothetical protein QO951_004320 [Salmonella enterica]|mgnify:CR=1 FL=1|uniref:hypothetical protein n=1 Tax=Enterobacteriaceae TaxID=543 RepID=UPI0007917085|nr:MULTISPECIES: hypothetical protein [Enterobacter cloacae complex]EAY4270142.1 hypothetical protein [Salmonella enterica]EFJ8793516.1 hypothetical protein [Escherichia coli]HCC7945892.1 hypothetical protein [Citrobacter freundii]HDT4905930.1 hypothetical protein [Enterobacter ludwigii]EFA3283554.1 hypothetical protein [Salmonella enterica]